MSTPDVGTEGAERLAICSVNDISAALTVSFRRGGLILSEKDLCPAFFDLRSRLASEVSQMFVNYRAPLAVVLRDSYPHGGRFSEMGCEHRQQATLKFFPDSGAARRWLDLKKFERLERLAPSADPAPGAMKPARVRRDQVTQLTDLPNIGPSMAKDLELIGISAPQQLLGKDPVTLCSSLCRMTGVRRDPCMLDTFISFTRVMACEPPKPWWSYTEERKPLYDAATGKR